MKFKAPIEVQAGISDGDPTNPLGISGYLLSSDGSNVNWVSPGELSAETAEAIVQPIKANEALSKGDPLYIVGFQAGQNVNIVAKADSSDAAKMPVVGLADDDYANQTFGTMTAFGSFNGDFDTTGGTESWAVGDIIFVKPGGGLTNIKPGGTDLIQNVAIVSRVQSQTGELEVIALGRTNDVPNLPAGRLFVGTAGVTSLLSDVVYIDDTNDRVGIGTNNPLAKLQVNTGSDINAQFGLDSFGSFKLGDVANNYTGAGVFYSGSPGSEDLQVSTNTFRISGNAGVGIQAVANGDVYLNTQFGVLATLDASTNNFGIGTTTPSGKLEVRQAANNGNTGAFTNTHLKLTASATADNTGFVGITAATSTADNYGYSFGAQRTSGGVGNFKINYHNNSAAGVNRFIIDQNGNVGIGDTDPDAKLTVFRTSTTFATALSTAESRAGLSVKSTSTYDAKLTVSTGISGIQQIQGVNNAATTGRDIAINPYGGNVGIGTTIPGEKLSVAPDTDVSAEIGKAHIGQVGFNDYAGFSHVDQNTQQGYALIQYSDGSTYINANTGKNIRFRIGNSDKMILNSSGNVGIGTTSPSNKLDVNGIIEADKLILPTAGTTGAGTVTTPAGKLDIRSDSTWSNSAIVARATTSPNPVLAFYRPTGSAATSYPWWLEANGSTFQIKTGSAANIGSESVSTKVTINSSGNVGIGTTSPQSKLQVNGGVQLANDTASPSASKVGTFRYRTSGNNSYVDMCMQTGASTYAWVNIVQNTW